MPLGHACSVFSGFAFKSNDFTDSGIPIIKIGNLQEGTVIVDDKTSRFPRSLFAPALEKFVLRRGDVLIAMTGATTGKVSVVPAACDGALVNQRVGKITPREESTLDVDFARSFLVTNYFQAGIQENILKSAQGNVSPKNIERILIPKPPDSEQRNIARCLIATERKTVAGQGKVAALDGLFKTLLHHLMTGRLRVKDLAVAENGGAH
jgi:type I restriction enzyme S subunit